MKKITLKCKCKYFVGRYSQNAIKDLKSNKQLTTDQAASLRVGTKKSHNACRFNADGSMSVISTEHINIWLSTPTLG
jgi:hypothetical protein